MSNLITISDFSPYRNLSANIGSEKIDPYVTEAQEFDLKPILGRALYYDFIQGMEASPQEELYTELFEGKDYTDPDTNSTIHFSGIKPMLIYYSYARIIPNLNKHATNFGFIEKENPYSNPVQDKGLFLSVSQARNAAEAYKVELIKFLDDNYSDYELWLKNYVTDKGKHGSIVITSVKKQYKKEYCGSCHSRYCNCNN